MNKPVAALVPSVALVMLASCDTNTRLDDHSYRGLGQSKPKPVRKFTAANMPEEVPTNESALTPATALPHEPPAMWWTMALCPVMLF